MKERRKTMVERVDGLPQANPAEPLSPSPVNDSVEVLGDAPAQVAEEKTVRFKEAIPVDSDHRKDEDYVRFRPVNRPSMGVLVVRDDGSSEGEQFRLREEHTVIGRDDCDVVVAHDPAISSRHCEIVRNLENGRYRWYIRDLGSTNGTFVRVFKTNLKHNQEWMIGSTRYRYQMAQSMNLDSTVEDQAPESESPKRHKSTMGWQAVTAKDLHQNQPALVTMLPSGEDGQVYPFSGDKLALGSDRSKCSLVLKDDPYLSDVHAVIRRTSSGPWKISDNKSGNGLWLRVSSLAIERSCEFQLGEQRFMFRVI